MQLQLAPSLHCSMPPVVIPLSLRPQRQVLPVHFCTTSSESSTTNTFVTTSSDSSTTSPSDQPLDHPERQQEELIRLIAFALLPLPLSMIALCIVVALKVLIYLCSRRPARKLIRVGRVRRQRPIIDRTKHAARTARVKLFFAYLVLNATHVEALSQMPDMHLPSITTFERTWMPWLLLILLPMIIVATLCLMFPGATSMRLPPRYPSDTNQTFRANVEHIHRSAAAPAGRHDLTSRRTCARVGATGHTCRTVQWWNVHR